MNKIMANKYNTNTQLIAVASMPIDEMSINTWFISIVYVVQTGHIMVSTLSKKKFWIWCGTQMHRIESREPYKSGYGGMPLFIYLVYTVWVSDRYILYRRQAINWFTRRVGLDNCYCNYLAICRYFFQDKKLFQLWIIFMKSLIITIVAFNILLLLILFKKACRQSTNNNGKNKKSSLV